MKSSLCTGQENSLRLGLYRCPQCGTRVQIFSDEATVKCYSCGGMVVREQVAPCMDWCVSAHECVGRNKNEKKEVSSC